MYRWIDERGVAHFSDGIDSVPENYRATAVPLGLRNAPPSPSGPAGTGAPASGAGSTEIRFVKGQAIVVNATINGGTSVRLMLDTGADRTVINPRALAAAGVSLTQGQAGQIRGATGTANVQSAVLDSLEIGGAKVSRSPGRSPRSGLPRPVQGLDRLRQRRRHPGAEETVVGPEGDALRACAASGTPWYDS